MTKNELVGRIANRLSVPKSQAREILDAVVEEITMGARHGDGALILRPLGTFKMKHRAARKARNPRTGETIEVPARDVLTFKEAAQ